MTVESDSRTDAFRDGIRLFNEEYFFEAHEYLEGLWHLERGPGRAFLQGLIQVCAGFHHFQNGNLIGALDLLHRGPDKMRMYPAQYMGIDAGTLLAKVESARQQIERIHRGETDVRKIVFPKIELPGATG